MQLPSDSFSARTPLCRKPVLLMLRLLRLLYVFAGPPGRLDPEQEKSAGSQISF